MCVRDGDDSPIPSRETIACGLRDIAPMTEWGSRQILHGYKIKQPGGRNWRRYVENVHNALRRKGRECMDVISQGTLTREWLETNGTSVDRNAESMKIAAGLIVYHYFDRNVFIGSVGLGDHILATGQVASKARQWSVEKLAESMSTEEPHYGDGTYVTCHSMLSMAPYELQRHHGISIARRPSRAVLEVWEPIRLIRIWQTGGIAIAPPDGPTMGLIFLGDPEVNVLRLEYLGDNGQWTP